MIDHLLRIKEKIKLLETISHIETIQSLLINTEAEFKMYHPVDVFMGYTSSRLEILDEDSPFYKVIEQSFINTKADSHS